MHEQCFVHTYLSTCITITTFKNMNTFRKQWFDPEEARRFAHNTHIPSILSTTGCLRFSLKMDFEVKTSR